MTELHATLESVGLSGAQTSYADRLDGDSLKTNLVVLGGPHPNLLCGEVMRRLTTTLKFGESCVDEIGLIDSLDNQYYAPEEGEPGELNNDFGVIYVCSNPFSPRKRLVLGAGSFGYGTWAAVRFLLSNEFFSHSLSACDAEFLIETEVLWKTPQHTRIRVARRLGDNR